MSQVNGRRRDVGALGSALLWMLLAWCPGAQALNPALDVSQYAHTAWKIREGFTKGTIFSLAQTPDGYLWLGTEFGLLRFDGVQAVPWQQPVGEQLPSDWINVLLVARDGTLWIGTEKGLASWKDGKLTEYPDVAGSVVTSLLQDAEGTLWFGVRNPGRLCAVRAAKTQVYGAGSFGYSVRALYEDHKGNLWVSAQTGLWRWAPGPPEHAWLPDGPIEAKALIEGDNGELLMATGISGPFAGPVNGSIEGLKQLVGGEIRDYALPGITGQFRPTRLFRSRDGSLWIGTTQGLLHQHQARFDGFSVTDGLSGNFVRDILEDREGNIWVCTENGLDRFREFAAPTVSVNQGLSTSAAYLVEATPDGSIWTITADGLNRWQNGQMIVYGNEGAPDQNKRTSDGDLIINARTTEIANSGIRGPIQSMGQDDQGQLWAGSPKGVFYFDRRRFVPVPGVPGGNILSMVGDGNGKVWISHNDEGLFYATPEGAVQQIPWALFGQKHGAVALLPDRLQGGLWLGFFDGGIAYLKDGQLRSSYTVANGLGNGSVNDLQFGSDSAVWAATEGGLSRVKDGAVKTLTSSNGLPCDAINSVIEDNDHSFWLYTACGLVRIARSELDAWVSDSKRSVQNTVFDSSDGVRIRALAGGHSRLMTKSPDGIIWFSPPDGVSSIDPRHLPFNKLPPPVYVQQITADGKKYDVSQGLRLPSRVRDLSIDFTALSLVVPEKVRFRFKLEPQDSNWREVLNDRHVQYSNLRPGNYRFRVTACNNSGVWNDEGAALDFSVAPAVYQTNWFRALCLGAFLALFWAAYRLRVRQLRSREKELRLAIDTIPGLVWTGLPDGNVDLVNQRWLEYTGLSIEDAIARGWQKAIHPDDLAGLTDYWRLLLASAKPGETEARLRRFDGEYRWFLFRAVPLHNSHGTIVKWYGTNTDIEDRKRAEDALRLSEACMARAQQLAGVGSYSYRSTHKDGNWDTCEYWSAELWHIADLDPSLGFPSTETIFSRIHPEDRQRTVEATERVIKDGRALDIKYRYFRADGQIRLLHTIATPIYEKGAATRLVGATMDITEQEQMTRELQRREMFLTEAQKLSHTGSFGWKPSTDEHFWSDETFRIWEYDASTKITLPLILDRIHPEDIPRTQQVIARAAAGGNDFELEYRLLMPAGSVKHIHVVTHAIGGDPGNFEFIGVVMDITERKQTQEALNAAKARFEGILEIAEDAIISVDSGQRIVLFNQGAEKVFGYRQTEVIGKPLDILLPQRFAHSHRGDIEGFAKSPDVSRKMGQRREVFGHRKDGSDFPAEASISKLALGTEVFFTVILRDITERKRTEETLRLNETLLAEGERISHTGSWVYKPATGELTSSKERFRIFGLDPEATPSSTQVFSERVHPDDKSRLRKILDSAIREKRDFEFEYRIFTPDMVIKHVHTVAHAITNESGELVEFFGSTADITERKKAEGALRETQAVLAHVTRVTTLGEVAASIAHELNQPLTAILNNANACLRLMSRTSPGQDDMRGALADIVSGAERGGAIIQRVRGMARRSAPQRTPVRFADVVNDIVALTAAESAARGIVIHTGVAPELPVVQGDRVQLQQVLLNLVVNGMDAMSTVKDLERGIEILGQLDAQDGHPAVRVSVRDRGVGLNAKEVDKLFEAFYTTKPHGMGLGLAISRSIIEAHAGQLWAESNNGPGATFAFRLPAISDT